MIQINTPYPATAYLMGFLRLHQARLALTLAQAEPALELFLRLFSRAGLERVLAALAPRGKRRRAPASAAVANLIARGSDYADTVDAAVRFLQGRDPGLALRIAGRAFLPEGPRFAAITPGDEGAAAPAAEEAPGDPLAW